MGNLRVVVLLFAAGVFCRYEAGHDKCSRCGYRHSIFGTVNLGYQSSGNRTHALIGSVTTDRVDSDACRKDIRHDAEAGRVQNQEIRNHRIPTRIIMERKFMDKPSTPASPEKRSGA